MKFKSKFQATMWRVSIASLVCLIAFQALHAWLGYEVLSTLRTTALTVFYHFSMRLIGGEWMVPRLCAKGIDGSRAWFQVHDWEAKLYRRLGVHRWKGGMPTYSPDEFSMRDRSLDEIIASTCRAELVHEIDAALSFVPLVFVLWFGAFWVFLITSVAAAVFDLVFVMMQRYNRPRLARLAKMREKRRES